MTDPQNLELGIAKFVQKFIEEGKDDKTMLVTKLHLILERMKLSEKENSMPFEMLSRLMEGVVNHHGLDPSACGANVAGPSSSKFTGAIENYGKPCIAGNEIVPLVDHERPSSLETKSGHLQEGDDLATGDKSNQNDGKRIINSKRKGTDSSSASEPQTGKNLSAPVAEARFRASVIGSFRNLLPLTK